MRSPSSTHGLPARLARGSVLFICPMVWADMRYFLEHPGEVLTRISEQMESDEATTELEERQADLSAKLAAKHKERDRYIRQYARGVIEEEELDGYLTDLRTQTDNLRLVLQGVEDDLARKHEEIALAETTEAWLATLRERIHEVEEDTEEAFEKRRELIRLLVERIDVGRDEDGKARVEVTYRFAEPPEPVDEEDVSVNGVKQGSASLATSAFCSASNRASGSSRYSGILRLSSERMSTTSSSQEVGTNAVARAYSCTSSPYGSKHL
jgi:hypothetical protein